MGSTIRRHALTSLKSFSPTSRIHAAVHPSEAHVTWVCLLVIILVDLSSLPLTPTILWAPGGQGQVLLCCFPAAKHSAYYTVGLKNSQWTIHDSLSFTPLPSWTQIQQGMTLSPVEAQPQGSLHRSSKVAATSSPCDITQQKCNFQIVLMWLDHAIIGELIA